MKFTKWDLMKLSQTFDGEINFADFTPDELEGLLGIIDDSMSPEQIREKYFEYYDDIKDRTLDKHKWSD